MFTKHSLKNEDFLHFKSEWSYETLPDIILFASLQKFSMLLSNCNNSRKLILLSFTVPEHLVSKATFLVDSLIVFTFSKLKLKKMVKSMFK